MHVLVLSDASTYFVGVGFALLAADCWASYILLNRLARLRLPGLQATAAASGVSALLYLPLASLLASRQLTGGPLLYAVAAGVLSSAVPFALDLTALRTVPAPFFGIFISAHPVLAALAGVVILEQVRAMREVVGIGIVVCANIIAIGIVQSTARGVHHDPTSAWQA